MSRSVAIEGADDCGIHPQYVLTVADNRDMRPGGMSLFAESISTQCSESAIQSAWLLVPAATLMQHSVWRKLASSFDGRVAP